MVKAYKGFKFPTQQGTIIKAHTNTVEVGSISEAEAMLLAADPTLESVTYLIQEGGKMLLFERKEGGFAEVLDTLIYLYSYWTWEDAATQNNFVKLEIGKQGEFEKATSFNDYPATVEIVKHSFADLEKLDVSDLYKESVASQEKVLEIINKDLTGANSNNGWGYW